MTTTLFKQPSCPKCNRNHNLTEGVLCSFCREDEAKKRDQQQPNPENYMVECLIEREGDTICSIGNIQYVFKRNSRGHSVCHVVNPGHYNHFMKIPQYRAYQPEDEEPVAEAVTLDAAELSERVLSLAAMGMNDSTIAETIGGGVTRQKVTKIRKMLMTGAENGEMGSDITAG